MAPLLVPAGGGTHTHTLSQFQELRFDPVRSRMGVKPKYLILVSVLFPQKIVCGCILRRPTFQCIEGRTPLKHKKLTRIARTFSYLYTGGASIFCCHSDLRSITIPHHYFQAWRSTAFRPSPMTFPRPSLEEPTFFQD